ncbi:MAG: archease [Xenococcaceae cyanobacterium MO_188.B19]|nr:archease [Xenococcaceae cyanobacterium MO_188.B19]
MTGLTKNFEEIEHTADWAYWVKGKNLAELLIQATLGLYSLVGMQLAPEAQTTRSIQLQALDRESLLVAWLNELLYLHESEGLGFEQIEIQHLDETTIQATVTGAPTQQWLKDIKAVTYHNLAIRETESGLEVTLVLDV